MVSGGKDSLYAAYLAESQGWPVGELLVMEPEDPDSWLYHTPNLKWVDLQGRAWSKPVRRVKVAASDAEGETEALRGALAGGRGPVCAGAIASSFQWSRLLRAAFACSRRVYAPLWRVDAGRVVREELAARFDIRIVQVAAEGLPVEWLGERLTSEKLDEIERRASRGPKIHPAGEGGEYETLVLDAPFFTARLAVDEATVVARGASAQWAIQRAHLEPKRAAPAKP